MKRPLAILLISILLFTALLPTAFAADNIDAVTAATRPDVSDEEWDRIVAASEECYDIGENGTLSARKNVIWPEILVLPSMVRGITVETIDYCGFMYRKEIEQIYIPNTVKQISGKAFAQCEDLETVYIPASVTSIEDNSFSMCPSLETIYYGGSKELWDSFGVFKPKDCVVYCDVIFKGSTEDRVSMPDWQVPNEWADEDWFEMGENGTLAARRDVLWPEVLVIPSSVRGITVETIDYGAFSGRSNIEKVYIPDTVEQISGKAFSKCQDLEEVYIPASVTSIEYSAFHYCYELESIYYGGSREEWGSFGIELHGDDCIIYCKG